MPRADISEIGETSSNLVFDTIILHGFSCSRARPHRCVAESDGLEAQILFFGRVFAKSPKLAPCGVLMPFLCKVFRADAEDHGLEAQIPCFERLFAKSTKLAPFEVLMLLLCKVFRAEYENGGLDGRIPGRNGVETLEGSKNF